MGSDAGWFWCSALMLSWFGHQSRFVLPRECGTGHLPKLSSVFASMFFTPIGFFPSVYKDRQCLQGDPDQCFEAGDHALVQRSSAPALTTSADPLSALIIGRRGQL